ncbi:hypothetical protein F7725_009344 [Dissostichus mawsoni]|uniref:Uncharacterized protein n=1 Tax=Dissostichus mawsoni TaxID=36200 RepID=A0A7J5Z6W8_DISMA|nr:hypothetical protein F7725_009344 [Dissostichus mawsoni]
MTGGGRVQLSRRRTPSNPGAAVRAEPAYSLYSTDSEDQVTTLHRGLDRCAALLGGMLQAENAEQRGPAAAAPPTPPPQTAIPPHQPPTPPPQTSVPPPPPQTSIPQPQSDPQAASEAPPTSCLSDCDLEEECVPVRDTDTHGCQTNTHLQRRDAKHADGDGTRCYGY